MKDLRDPKRIAEALRTSLAEKNIKLGQGEALENGSLNFGLMLMGKGTAWFGGVWLGEAEAEAGAALTKSTMRAGPEIVGAK